MNRSHLPALGGLFAVFLLLAAACSQKTVPPRVLTVPELISGLETTFAAAKPDTKTLESDVVSALKLPDYSRAYLELQKLMAQPNLSKAQGSLLASALLTVNGLLQTAQTQGDTNAMQVLQYYHANK